MIVREILQEGAKWPSGRLIIDDFDYFNDYKDTRSYLLGVKERQPHRIEEVDKILERLDAAHAAQHKGSYRAMADMPKTNEHG